MARDLVRGSRRQWLQELFGFALVPDLVVYLRADPETLLHRAFRKYGQLDYWESGMDLGLSGDMVNSFRRYQTLLQAEFDHMAGLYGFITLDGNREVEPIRAELCAHIEALLLKRGKTVGHSRADRPGSGFGPEIRL